MLRYLSKISNLINEKIVDELVTNCFFFLNSGSIYFRFLAKHSNSLQISYTFILFTWNLSFFISHFISHWLLLFSETQFNPFLNAIQRMKKDENGICYVTGWALCINITWFNYCYFILAAFQSKPKSALYKFRR